MVRVYKVIVKHRTQNNLKNALNYISYPQKHQQWQRNTQQNNMAFLNTKFQMQNIITNAMTPKSRLIQSTALTF